MKIIAGCLMLLSVACFAQEETDSTELSGIRKSSPKKEQKIKDRQDRKCSKKDTSTIITQPLRIEIPVENRNDDFEVVKGHEEGLLVIQNTKEYTENGIIWKFHMVNNDLVIDWETEQFIPSSHSLVGYDYNADYYFLLFENERKYLQYHLIVIDVKGQNTMMRNFSLAFEMDIQYLEALDMGILLAGTHNYRPVAMIYDIINDVPKVLPGFYNRNERIFDLVMDDVNHSFSTVLTEKMRNGMYTNRVKTFTYDGLLMLESVLNPGENLNLIDGKTTSFGNGVQYMAGTYSKKASLYSRGIYVSKFTNGSQQFIKSYNYADLKNFFKFRGEKAARRVQKRISKKKAKGKEPKFEYRLYIHSIVQRGDINILIAEAYYAQYSSGTTNYSTYGRGGYSNPYYGIPGRRGFLGYKFTHAVLMAFDSRGNMIWDNSFKTNDITTYNLEESVAVNVQDDRAVIMYLDDDLLKSKVVEGDEVVEGKTYNQVKLLYPGDVVRGSSETKGIESWYDNYLYSYGIQRVTNKLLPNSSPDQKRKVFYLNKIQFDTAPANSKDFRISSVK